MTQDTYLKIVKDVLQSDASIRIQASHQSRLNTLAREVARGKDPKETIEMIEAMFSPDFGRHLRQAFERAFR